MNAWAADFDNWGICDTACFHLFSRTPFGWEKARQWAKSPREFVKRGAFALMASLVLRDKTASDAEFLALLPLIEKGAQDERNLVKKGVNWALRTIGKRSPVLNEAAVAAARRRAESPDPAPRWVGKDALRELAGPAVKARLARRNRG
jgi:3-methyladenine DNA glycosylase AlkD